MADTIDINDFSDALYKTISSEFKDVNKKVNKGIERISRDTKKIVQEKSPVYKGNSKNLEKGKYQKNWEITTLTRNGTSRKVVHNKQYQLVHLLELGHDLKKKNGEKYGDAMPYPHVEKAQEYANRETDKLIAEVANDS